MLWHLVARSLYWAAQGAMPLGRPGARLARRLLGWVLALTPSEPRARGWLAMLEGVFAREQGDFERAIALLREAGDLLPDSDAVIANLGIALTAAGRNEEAVETLERALRGGSDIAGEPQLWTALAWAYLRSGRAPKAQEACDRADDHRAGSRDLQLIRLLALAAERGTINRDDLAPLLRLCPRMLPVVLAFSQHLAHDGSHDTARRILDCLPPQVAPRAYSVIARSALNEGDLNTALWAARELHRHEPEAILVPLLRSEVSAQRGHFDAALRQAREALALKPTDAELLEHVVRVQVLRGDWEAAVEAAQQAIAAGSKGALSAGVLALHHLGQANLREAQALFHTPRAGGALACAFAQAAQAAIFGRQGDQQAALTAARLALDYLAQMPVWEAPPHLAARVRAELREVLKAVSAGPDTSEIADLRSRLEEPD